MSAVTHEPTVTVYKDRHVVDCSCGHRGELWVSPTGAVLSFLTHVAQEAARALGIDNRVSVELWSGAHD